MDVQIDVEDGLSIPVTVPSRLPIQKPWVMFNVHCSLVTACHIDQDVSTECLCEISSDAIAVCCACVADLAENLYCLVTHGWQLEHSILLQRASQSAGTHRDRGQCLHRWLLRHQLGQEVHLRYYRQTETTRPDWRGTTQKA